MPRVIFKCPHIKPGTDRAAAHLNNYVRYIGTREGVDRVDPGKANLPPTEKQQAMVEQLLREFPLSRGMFEYEDYLAAPTRASASEFISRAMEENLDQIAKRENYVDYIANRPRAERVGSHGLFTGEEDALILSQVAEAVAHHPGTVWLPIISLRREDADRLGYNSAKQWRELISGYAPQIAEAMKIPPDQFRWYAAFHDEGHHPHLHMVCYSADGKSGFLSKTGIAKIKSGLAKDIFRQDLTELYQRQTQQRDELTQETRDRLRQLIGQMRDGTLENPKIERLMLDLAERLKKISGKKQYGYLKAPLKSIVDEIVDELEKDPRLSTAYELWYQLQEEVLRTYRNDLPPRVPLSRQKEFKRIKNLVIEEAVKLGWEDAMLSPAERQDEPDLADITIDPEEPAFKSMPPEVHAGTEKDQYHLAKLILDNPRSEPEEISQAIEWLTNLAEDGSQYAQYALGKLYRDGGTVERSPVHAVIWFSQAAEQGSEYAMYALGKLNLEAGNASAALRWFRLAAERGNQFAQYQLGRLLLHGDDITRDVEEAVHQFTASAEQGNQYAQYILGKLCLLGKDVPQDREAAARWFTMAAEQGSEYAQYFLDRMNDSQGPPFLTSATRLLHHMSRIFQDEAPPSLPGIHFTESKLRRRIREKKIAMGHKADDHEDQPIMTY